jgi:hypothetical protein
MSKRIVIVYSQFSRHIFKIYLENSSFYLEEGESWIFIGFLLQLKWNYTTQRAYWIGLNQNGS